MIRGAGSVGRELEDVRRHDLLLHYRRAISELRSRPQAVDTTCAASFGFGVEGIRRLGGPLPADWPVRAQAIRDGGLFDPAAYPTDEPDHNA